MQPRRASCIVLLRQGKDRGLEVLMAQRSKALKSFGGAFVFPGGVVEFTDGPVGSREQTKKCGLRELFEEAGVLLEKSARGNRAKPVSFNSTQERRTWQKRVRDDPKEFDTLLKEKNIKLATEALFYLVTFITPEMEERRFNTDFYVVDSRYEEAGLELDEAETISLRWITPQDALTANKEGKMMFLPPQYFVLNSILKFGKTPSEVISSLVDKQDNFDELCPILPHPVSTEEKEGSGSSLCLTYPGDEEHCEYPGNKGDRNRVLLKGSITQGRGGFEHKSNLKNISLTKKEWENLTKSAKL